MKRCCASWLAFTMMVLCFVCIGDAKHFTVQVTDESQLDQVAEVVRQRGFYVKHVNKRFGFVSFSTSRLPSTDADVSAAALDAAAADYKPATTGCALIGDSADNTPLYADGTDASQCTAAASGALPTFPGPRAGQVTAAAATGSPVEAALQSLADTISGIVVAEDPQVYLMRQLKQSDGSAGEPAASSCTPGPDGAIGKETEEAPYGIKMVQATEPEMIDISKTYKNKVMFCVIDTGVDTKNFEFSDNTIGCVPKTVRPDGTNTSCRYPFSRDWSSHGTHTSGTIAAQRNGRGVVGVSAEGALLYHYNAFGPMGTFSMSEVIIAITDCVEELDSQRKVKNMPDMKLVVSMSFGAEADTPLVKEAVKTLARERYQDILLIAAAGNGALEGSVYSYPAAWPEVVSVAAVDWAKKRAAFSQVNEFNDWAAPGVQTLSTIPLADAAQSTYNSMPTVTITPALLSSDASFLQTPAPRKLGNSKSAKISGSLVDCGIGKQTCQGATGKICLLQRGENSFCQKVVNCLAGGGIGAVIYGRDDQSDCETFDGSLEGGCTAPTGGWPVGITLTKSQGKTLKSLVAAHPGLTVTIDGSKSTDPLPFDFMSGTSMATPTAAGVAGLVWSAHTSCSGPEIRAAISWTAQDLGAAGFDKEFGHGLVQAAAAHKYLLANPCTGTRTPVEPQRGDLQQRPASEPLRKLQIVSSVANLSTRVFVGDTIRFTLSVSATAEKQQTANIGVRLLSQPANALACGSAAIIRTNANGIAQATCSVLRPGNLVFEARIGNAADGDLVTARTTITAYRRRQAGA